MNSVPATQCFWGLHYIEGEGLGQMVRGTDTSYNIGKRATEVARNKTNIWMAGHDGAISGFLRWW